MVAIFLQTLPFFLLIGLGYGAGRTGFMSEAATAAITRFVFYFALSAMLFRFAANLSFADVFDWVFLKAYICGTALIYVVATLVAVFRRIPAAEAAVEAQCAVIGNIGFLGIPMLALLLGEASVSAIIMMLAVDLIVFGSLIVVIITGSRGKMSLGIVRTVFGGLLANPMIVSISLGLLCSALELRVPAPIESFLAILDAAATPGALFAIGASLAAKSAERVSVALWLSFAKLFLHPAAIAIMALVVFPVEPYAAGVMIASAAMPVAGNIYMIAAHYGVAPARVSASILISTVISVVTLTVAIGWVLQLQGG